jgi:hypothetical protein
VTTGRDFVDVDARLLADWLQTQPPEKLWTIDGEDSLAGAYSFPCGSKDMARLLADFGTVRIFVDKKSAAAWTSHHDIGMLAQTEGQDLLFALGGPDDDEPCWLLVEDRLAESLEAAGM